MSPLSDEYLRSLAPETMRYDVTIFDDFVLSVLPNGLKTWAFLYEHEGRTRRKTLGVYPDMSYEQAEDAVDHARQMILTLGDEIKDSPVEPDTPRVEIPPEAIIPQPQPMAMPPHRPAVLGSRRHRYTRSHSGRRRRGLLASRKMRAAVLALACVALVGLAALALPRTGLLGGASDAATGDREPARAAPKPIVLSTDQPAPVPTEPTRVATAEPVPSAAPKTAPEPDPEPDPEPKSAPAPAPQPEPLPEPVKTEPVPAPVPAPAPAPEPGPLPEPEPTANLEPIPEPEPKPEPEPEAPVEPVVVAQITPEPDPLREPEAELTAEPEPAPQPERQPQLEPTITAAAATVDPVPDGATSTGGKVARAIVTSGVENIEPIDDLGQDVSPGSGGFRTVFFFTELRNFTAGQIVHRWRYNGRVIADVPLKVAGNWRWRTYSSKDLLPGMTGDWEVSVIDGDGRVLGLRRFRYEL